MFVCGNGVNSALTDYYKLRRVAISGVINGGCVACLGKVKCFLSSSESGKCWDLTFAPFGLTAVTFKLGIKQARNVD